MSLRIGKPIARLARTVQVEQLGPEHADSKPGIPEVGPEKDMLVGEVVKLEGTEGLVLLKDCLLYTSPSPRDRG